VSDLRVDYDRTVAISGVWLRRRGDRAQVLVEHDGRWRLLADEPLSGHFSHIIEARAIPDRPLDPVTERV
jgi:hypothetical protein